MKKFDTDPELKKIRPFLNLHHTELFKKVKSRTDLIELPIKALWGVTEKHQADFEFATGCSTIQELADTKMSLDKMQERTGTDRARLQAWLIAARLIVQGFPDTEFDDKFLLLGLDNAGKTAIVTTLTRIQNAITKAASVETILALEPTRGVERKTLNYLDYSINLWDLGGQKNYREMYLKAPDRFFPNTAVVFFVIDIWDTIRFEEAFDYLKNITAMFEYLDINPLFVVLLHKADPVRRKELKIELTLDLLKTYLSSIPTFNRHIPRIEFTSIYDEQRLFKIFAETIREYSPVKDVVNEIAMELIKYLKADAILLLTSSGLELSHAGSEVSVPILQQITLELLETEYAVLGKRKIKIEGGILQLDNDFHFIAHRFEEILQEGLILSCLRTKGRFTGRELRHLHRILNRKMAPLVLTYLSGAKPPTLAERDEFARLSEKIDQVIRE
jgi:ADP-ribosylation factor-like protein 2